MQTPPQAGASGDAASASGSGQADAAKGAHLSHGDRRIVGFAHWVIRWRWAVLLLGLVAGLGAGFGGQYLSFSTDYRVFFSQENPQLNAFESLQRVYTKDDNLMVVLQPAEGEVFSPDLLRTMQDLTEEAWKVPYTTRVDSLTNFQNSYAVGEDDLIVEDLVPSDSPLDSVDLARIREVALSEPLILNRLVAPDARTAAVNITLNLPQKSMTETPEAMDYIRGLADDLRAKHPDLRVAITGSVALNAAFTEASVNDLSTLIPIMYGILLLVMVLLLRSFASTVSTLVVIGLSAMSAMGLAGWFGIQLTPPSATAPTIILTLAIADSIHILVSMLGEMRKGASKRDALVESLRINFQPVFLTSLTTVIGFLSLNFSDAPPFRDLGNITALGVAAAWVYSILFLPALLAVLPMRARKTSDRAVVAERIGQFVLANRRLLLSGMAVVVIASAVVIPRIELNDQFVNYFDTSIPFRTDTDFAMDNLSGIYQAQWSLPSGQASGINEPQYLKAVEGFTEWLRERDRVVHVNTITDIVKRLNKNMHADRQAWYRLPDDRELAAQYLLLFEMSLPYGLDLNNQINVDKSSTRIIATLENLTTVELRELDRDASAWLAENMPAGRGEGLTATGPFVMFAYIAERNIQTMLVGTVLAFLLISLTLGIALRNVRLGLISLVPNLVPAVMAFGLWSVLVGQIGLASSVVTATSLGIIVDATVHFLSKYRRARLIHGADPERAVGYAFSTVGTALWVTAAILVAGFAVLALSSFEINQSMGKLTAITIAMALIADFLLLPPMLIALDKVRARNKAPTARGGAAATQPAE